MTSRRRVIRVPREGPLTPLEAPNGAEASPVPAAALERPQGRTKTVDLGLFDRRKPVVVGIDQSLVAFGLVAYSYEDDTAFCWLHKPAGHGVRRLFDIQSFLRGVFQQITLRCGEPEHVTMEGYAFATHAGREVMGECGAATKMALVSALGIAKQVAYPSLVTPQQVKKFATSRGNAKKNEVLLAIYKKWGVTFTDDNLADAYALARVAAALATGESKYDYEQDVIRRIARNTEWELQSKTKPLTSSTKAKKPSSG